MILPVSAPAVPEYNNGMDNCLRDDTDSSDNKSEECGDNDDPLHDLEA